MGHAGGGVTCKGEKVNVDNVIIDGVLVTTDHEISISRELVHELYKTGDLEIQGKQLLCNNSTGFH